MLLKTGVDISRLERPIRRALNKIDAVFQKYGKEAVITSTYEGSHSPGSLHYANLAVDIRLRDLSNDEKVLIQKDLMERLGSGFDIINEGNHLHFEYDP